MGSEIWTEVRSVSLGTLSDTLPGLLGSTRNLYQEGPAHPTKPRKVANSLHPNRGVNHPTVGALLASAS